MINTIKSKAKKLLIYFTRRATHIKKGITCKHVWYGNRYGGFYICPEFLNENSIIYSFGIGEDISFDLEIIKRHNSNIYGFDPTPKSINWIRNLNLPVKFSFFEYGISTKSGFSEFYLPKDPQFISGSYIIQKNISLDDKITVTMKSLKDIAHSLGHKHIDVLKIDIEGAEYDVIESILDSNISINQILIEFHERLFENGKALTQKAIENLKKNQFEIFAISDSFEEISFINRNHKLVSV